MTPYESAEAQRRIQERRYRTALQRVARELHGILQGAQTPQEMENRIGIYTQSKAFNALAEQLARNMITATAVGQYKTWRAAAAASTRGRDIFLALRNETQGTALGAAIDQLIARNSTLIRTVPQTIAQRLSRIAQQEALKGSRTEHIMEKMRHLTPGLTETQLRRIARTETAKAQSALMQARCEALGIEMYIWRSCRDERVRDAHGRMDGVLCCWGDPPNPEAVFGTGHDSGGCYHPGGIYNCRCIALPVIDYRDIIFPIRAHVHGRVHSFGSVGDLNKAIVRG